MELEKRKVGGHSDISWGNNNDQCIHTDISWGDNSAIFSFVYVQPNNVSKDMFWDHMKGTNLGS